ncbi:MAG: hypothetical protein EOO09_21345 [Chitinophagaceae bacterium]|nr:MAG: hypothetical protein EOO09_21345 [Chitinophagaceae bacterium]
MKNYRIKALTLALILATGVSNAQQSSLLHEQDNNKPRLFTQLPSRIPVETAELEKLISNNQETGKDAALDLTGKGSATFAGKVVSTASKYDNSIRSIVIRSSSFNGATFSLSALADENGNIRYTGRIISFKHGDVYELESQDNQYVLVKKDFNRLVQE